MLILGLKRGAPYAHLRRVFFGEALPLVGTRKLYRNTLKAGAGSPRISPRVKVASEPG
jgi:hypothetical protein